MIDQEGGTERNQARSVYSFGSRSLPIFVKKPKMSDPLADPDSPTILTPRLRLSFVWTGDRWTHVLSIGERVVARPVELDPSDEHPARVVSPAYQQMNFQDGPDGSRQALLVGQSGPHHFSAVFTVRDDGRESTIEVDFADRSRSPIEILAATYTVFLASGDLIEADDRRIRWGFANTRLDFEAEPPTTTGLAEAGRGATRVQALAAVEPTLKTQRSVYRWRVS